MFAIWMAHYIWKKHTFIKEASYVRLKAFYADVSKNQVFKRYNILSIHVNIF